MSKALITALLAVGLASGGAAQQRSANKNGFTLAAGSGKTILVFRPTVRVGAQSTGGMFEPNGEWTEQSRKNIDDALAKMQGDLGNRVIDAPESYGSQAQLVDEYSALFSAISQSVITYQFFVGNRLPTKKRDNKADVFDWSMGSGVAELPGAHDADYALFLYDKDAYGSTGRKVLQVVALLGPGIAIKSGEHAGYAGLIDLKTGDVLWLNANGEMGGDVRTAEGAEKRISELLKGFPGRKSTGGAELAAPARP